MANQGDWDSTINSGAQVTTVTRETARLIGHDSGVESVVFSPDSSLLASSSWDGTVRLWSVSQPERPLAVLEGMRRALAAVAFDPTSQFVLTGADDGALRVWTRAGAPVLTLASGEGDTRTTLYSPDGHMIAASFSTEPVLVWTAQGAPLARLDGHAGGATDIAFSPNGKWLVSGDTAGVARLWETSGWRLVASFQGAPSAGADGAQPSAPATPKRSKWIGFFQWTPDSRRLAFWGEGAHGKVQLWEVGAAAEALTNQPDGFSPRWIGEALDPEYRPIAIQFAPDGRTLAVADTYLKTPAHPTEEVRLYDSMTAQEAGSLPTPNDFALRLAYSPDGRYLAVGGAAGMVWLWDVARRRLAAQIAAHTDSWDWHAGSPVYALGALAWSPDGQWIATAGLAPLDQDNAEQGPATFPVKLWRVADLGLGM